ncbi:MAG: HAD family acid phosphatase [Micromonosporaceae bacterium]
MELVSPRPYAVLDIDATLSDVRHRVHHLKRRPKRWDAFFAGAGADQPLPEGLAVAATLAEDHDIVYLTGRPERLRRVTQHWLDRYGLPSGELLMRRDDDRSPSAAMKLRRLRRLAADRTVAVLVDDDILVCEAAERAGFTVLRADWALDEDTEPTLFDAQESEGRT